VQTERIVDEATPIEPEKHSVLHGYEASKWVAEKLFLAARERGIRSNIFRPGLIWADAVNGRYDEGQWPYKLLKSCLLSGYGLKDFRFPMAPTPVDHIATAVVSLAASNPEGHGIFHLSSSAQSVEDVFACCNRLAGMELDLLEATDWLAAVRRMHREGQSLPVVPLIDFALWDDQNTSHSPRYDTLGLTRFDCARTYRQLERASIVAPIFSDDLLRLAVRDMLARDRDLRRMQFHEGRKDAARSFERAPAVRASHVVE
jgi:thioester reductase-like protein